MGRRAERDDIEDECTVRKSPRQLRKALSSSRTTTTPSACSSPGSCAGAATPSSKARSSDEALALGDDLELLVADLVMPSIGGVELADAMRARIPGLHVLFTSGHCRIGNSFGPDDPLLAKPFTAAELLQRVRQLIDPRS
jgi:CheY-like chemotaxis protein